MEQVMHWFAQKGDDLHCIMYKFGILQRIQLWQEGTWQVCLPPLVEQCAQPGLQTTKACLSGCGTSPSDKLVSAPDFWHGLYPAHSAQTQSAQTMCTMTVEVSLHIIHCAMIVKS